MNILLAEDDPSLRLLLEDFLAGLGHTVRSAENGNGLVRQALEARPDLIITDLQMPEMSGDSMIAMLDLYPGLVGIPVIVITGAAHGELADMGIDPDIPVFRKPLDLEKVAGQIEKISGRGGKV
jgi:CheY-like chemotaxis protein